MRLKIYATEKRPNVGCQEYTFNSLVTLVILYEVVASQITSDLNLAPFCFEFYKHSFMLIIFLKTHLAKHANAKTIHAPSYDIDKALLSTCIMVSSIIELFFVIYTVQSYNVYLLSSNGIAL